MIKVKMTNNQFLSFWNALQILLNSSERFNPKLQLALMRNSRRIEPDIKILDEVLRKKTEEYENYLAEIEKVNRGFARLNQNGDPVILPDGNYDIEDKDRRVWQAAVEVERKKHVDAIAQQEAHAKQMRDEVLPAEEEHDGIITVSLDLFPNTGIENRVMTNLWPMIKEMHD